MAVSGCSMEGTEGVNSQPGNAGNTEQDSNGLKKERRLSVYSYYIYHHTLLHNLFIQSRNKKG